MLSSLDKRRVSARPLDVTWQKGITTLLQPRITAAMLETKFRYTMMVLSKDGAGRVLELKSHVGAGLLLDEGLVSYRSTRRRLRDHLDCWKGVI